MSSKWIGLRTNWDWVEEKIYGLEKKRNDETNCREIGHFKMDLFLQRHEKYWGTQLNGLSMFWSSLRKKRNILASKMTALAEKTATL